MPVLAIVSHLSLVHPDMFPTAITVLCIHALKTLAAVGPAFSHDVPLSSKLLVTLKTAEMLHVPATPFSLRTLIRKDDLITGSTAWFQGLGMMTSTVHFLVLIEVDEINEKFLARGTFEAGWMPCNVVTRS
jgi:hypothetical protein